MQKQPEKNSGLNGTQTHDRARITIPQNSIWFSHIHICIIHYYRVYDELTIDHLSMWLDSSVDRALHRYRKVMGYFFNWLSWKHIARITISLMFIRSSHIWFSYIHIYQANFKHCDTVTAATKLSDDMKFDLRITSRCQISSVMLQGSILPWFHCHATTYHNYKYLQQLTKFQWIDLTS